MKRLLGVVLGSLVIAGCSEKQPIYSDDVMSPNNPIMVSAWGGTGYVDVATIDGCQYITSKDWHGAVVFAHKGNCNNPIHNYRVEKQ